VENVVECAGLFDVHGLKGLPDANDHPRQLTRQSRGEPDHRRKSTDHTARGARSVLPRSFALNNHSISLKHANVRLACDTG